MKLYHFPLSGHSHRAHLFLSLVGVPHELVDVDLKTGQHKTPDFLKLNTLGQVPVLDDGGVIVPDSLAIIVYVARKLGLENWLPTQPIAAAAVQRWFSVAAGQLRMGPAAARLITVFGAKYDVEQTLAAAHAILKLIDQELIGHDWIVLDRPTAADVALYSYIASAPEGNVDLSSYAQIGAWLRRVEALPGFVPFQKTAVGLAA
ncbi:glutathione S-transferase family protein [Labrys sp. KB_33_2]|uniref:glutathione S-transferase family protein n=1 Tax=unclassified Labrys (in: a-proteobacteria) TaxID=2688601 RepID=UPI003EB8BDD6